MQQDNPLYNEYADEELRVDLFQHQSDEETEGMKISICLLLFTCFTFLFFTHTHTHTYTCLQVISMKVVSFMQLFTLMILMTTIPLLLFNVLQTNSILCLQIILSWFLNTIFYAIHILTVTTKYNRLVHHILYYCVQHYFWKCSCFDLDIIII